MRNLYKTCTTCTFVHRKDGSRNLFQHASVSAQRT